MDTVGNAKVVEITENAVTVEVDGVKQVIPAETVIMATGMRPNETALDELEAVVRYTSRVGDCNKVSNLMDAIHSGFQAVVDL